MPLLHLAAGAGLRINGVDWTLSGPGGREQHRGGLPQPVASTDLVPSQLERARLRAEHVLEAETGYRSGHPARALPGEPRPPYDPATTTVTQRRRAKASELAALGRAEAAMLGLFPTRAHARWNGWPPGSVRTWSWPARAGAFPVNPY
ncbi:hypothetical protein ACIRRI_46110 [Streptomyces mirabilis]|uniref:hypothetical protein n=1 Tax=Streptomyces mirabilis TaxID=68239 RepID=UPI0038205329